MRRLVYAGLWVFVLVPIASAQTQNWPQFSGAQADGLGEGDTLPDTWKIGRASCRERVYVLV